MAVLTKTQLEYAKARIGDAKKKYIEVNMPGDPPETLDYTVEEKLTMIAAGDAKLKRPSTDSYGYLTAAFSYPLTVEMQLAADAYEKWSQTRDAVWAEANKREEMLLDELIMSSDGAAALARIAEVFAAA